MGNTEDSNSGKYFMVIKAAMNLPGVQIRRSDFLRKELSTKFQSEIIDLAIERNPAYAGITTEDIEDIAKGCINYETNCASTVSFAAGIPGGFAMIGTVPADLAQYYARMIRILQKLIYLYGWPELYNSEGDFDDNTMTQLTLFLGVMFGVGTANAAVTKIAQSTALKVEKDLARKALTKGTIYPIVKKIAQTLGMEMTKEIFAKGVGKIIPFLGGFVSGTLTYVTFKPMSLKLKNHLKKLPTADIKYYSDFKNKESSNVEPDFDNFEFGFDYDIS